MVFFFFCGWSDECVIQLNLLRALHRKTNDVVWNEEIAKEAQKQADKLAERPHNKVKAVAPDGWSVIVHAPVENEARRVECSEALMNWLVYNFLLISNYEQCNV